MEQIMKTIFLEEISIFPEFRSQKTVQSKAIRTFQHCSRIAVNHSIDFHIFYGEFGDIWKHSE